MLSGKHFCEDLPSQIDVVEEDLGGVVSILGGRYGGPIQQRHFVVVLLIHADVVSVEEKIVKLNITSYLRECAKLDVLTTGDAVS